MNWFSSKKTHQKLVAVFDIGSASIGGSLVLLSQTPKGVAPIPPKILHVVRHPFIFQEDFDFSRFVFSMLQALEATGKDLEALKLGAPKEVYCYLSSPWCAGQTRVVTFQKNTPFTFTKKLWRELIGREVATFKVREFTDYMEAGDEIRILEQKTMHMALNGYPITDPVGKKATDLAMSLYVSISPEKIVAAIEHSIEHFFRAPLHFSSFVFGTYIAVRDAFAGEKQFLLVDVAGEVTDIGLVRDGILSESASFPSGKNFVVRRVSTGLNRTGPDALALINLATSGSINQNMKPDMDKLLEKARTEWLSYFQSALANMSSDLSLPSTVFLTADADMAAWFQNAIKTEQFNQYILTEKQFNVILIGAESLHTFVSTDSVKERDPFLMLETIVVNRINQ